MGIRGIRGIRTTDSTLVQYIRAAVPSTGIKQQEVHECSTSRWQCIPREQAKEQQGIEGFIAHQGNS
jgi:hypothetical protein